MSKPTTGYFEASKGSEFEPDRWIIQTRSEPHYLIATIENGQPGDTLDTEEATAHIFAASKDLLEALEEARASLADGIETECELEHPGSKSDRELISKIDKAIARAKGEL